MWANNYGQPIPEKHVHVHVNKYAYTCTWAAWNLHKRLSCNSSLLMCKNVCASLLLRFCDLALLSCQNTLDTVWPWLLLNVYVHSLTINYWSLLSVIWDTHTYMYMYMYTLCKSVACSLLLQSGRSLLVKNFKFIFSHLVRNCSQKALSVASSFLKVCADTCTCMRVDKANTYVIQCNFCLFRVFINECTALKGLLLHMNTEVFPNEHHKCLAWIWKPVAMHAHLHVCIHVHIDRGIMYLHKK